MATDFGLRVGSASGAEIELSNAWLRATIGQSNVTAGYVVIENKGTGEDRLLSVHTTVAAKTEMHQTSTGEGGIMRMRPVSNLSIPVGQAVAFRSGGDHLMLSGIATPLKAGDFIDLTLSFEVAGDLLVTAKVSRRNPYP
ncbi:MAG: copper chaperone PCu(A)C [Rhodospirillaceae bacterium]|nr:copper chaperone PCu(A)C [Rhodospirillaceae bacterium]MBT5239569.1 copper chaperone PCu(A)C [Rhodospirillaceae bacterium]MBT6089946.1 copper chaperone PCu(A)C [Rhodospirillaceae bacterium]MBT7450174.1 copper chaperone PCu(A)C [Rhodospirillaceae bacterium]